MKKVLCILAAIAMIAVFSTSCNKKCHCKTPGGSVTYDLKYLQDNYGVEIEKCGELTIEGVIECK